VGYPTLPGVPIDRICPGIARNPAISCSILTPQTAARAFPLSRICPGLDRGAGKSPKIHFDAAGDVQVVSEDQAAEEIGQARGVRLLSAGRRLRLQAVQIGGHFLDRSFGL